MAFVPDRDFHRLHHAARRVFHSTLNPACATETLCQDNAHIRVPHQHRHTHSDANAAPQQHLLHAILCNVRSAWRTHTLTRGIQERGLQGTGWWRAGGTRQANGTRCGQPVGLVKGVEWTVRMARAPRATSVVWRSRSEWQT